MKKKRERYFPDNREIHLQIKNETDTDFDLACFCYFRKQFFAGKTIAESQKSDHPGGS